MRHGTRGRYEKGCRCDACRAAKSPRNAQYRERHQDEIATKQRARSRKPRTPRTTSGIVGIYYVPEAPERLRRLPVGFVSPHNEVRAEMPGELPGSPPGGSLRRGRSAILGGDVLGSPRCGAAVARACF